MVCVQQKGSSKQKESSRQRQQCSAGKRQMAMRRREEMRVMRGACAQARVYEIEMDEEIPSPSREVGEGAHTHVIIAIVFV